MEGITIKEPTNRCSYCEVGYDDIRANTAGGLVCICADCLVKAFDIILKRKPND